MVETLKEAGIRNYTIWNVGTELFGYYECEKGYDFARDAQATSPVVARWDVYMADILTFDTDDNGNQLDYRCVFVLD
jgi:L-rhamnose mutarotase